MTQHRVKPLSISLLLTVFLLFFTACGGTATPPDSGLTGTPTATTPVTPTPTVSVSTDCPASNTGRAAVRPALDGTHSADTLVYVRQTSAGSSLVRYDVASHHETEIIHKDGQISNAKLSHNGDWITFVYRPASGDTAIQLVRLDGTLLQTVYCAPSTSSGNSSIFSVTISPDEHFLAFMQGNDLSSAPIQLLDLSAGSVQEELVAPHPGAISGMPTFWLDNTHLYLTGFVPNSGAPLVNIYLLDTAHGAHQTMSSVATVLETPHQSFDYSSRDGKLYVNTYSRTMSMGADGSTISGPSSIRRFPDQGGSVIDTPVDLPSEAITGVRAIVPADASDPHPNLILYTIETTGGTQNGLYMIDGTGTPKKLLATNKSIDPGEHYPQAQLSPDHSKFAVKVTDFSANSQAILIRPLDLSATEVTIASSTGNDNLDVVGWTRY